jgi:hypothetical protein
MSDCKEKFQYKLTSLPLTYLYIRYPVFFGLVGTGTCCAVQLGAAQLGATQLVSAHLGVLTSGCNTSCYGYSWVRLHLGTAQLDSVPYSTSLTFFLTFPCFKYVSV